MTFLRAFIPLLLLLATLTVHLSSTVNAQEPLVIRGRVANMTRGGTVPADLEITLHVIQGQEQVQLLQTTVEEDATFQFSLGLSEGNLRYVFVAVYQGVLYSILVETDVAEMAGYRPVELVIYESTRSQESLGVVDDVLLVTGADADEGTVRVFERLTLVNRGDRTYVPDLEQPQQMNFLRFSLPPGATSLDVRGDLEGGEIITVDRGFAITAPVPPGEHQLGFSYEAPYQKGSLAFSKSIPWGAEVFRAMMPQALGMLEGRGLDQIGPVIVGGVNYHLLEARDVLRGETIEVRLSQLPQPTLWKRAWRGLTGGDYAPIVAPTVMGVALVILLAVGFRRRRAAVAQGSIYVQDSASDSLGEKDSLVEAIASLDDRYEQGEIEEREYRQQREDLKARLLQVALRSKQEGDASTSPGDETSDEV